jgi:asparagine synthetase B (glutamine-hydrolysing)
MAGFIGICSRTLASSQAAVANATDETLYSAKASSRTLCDDDTLVLSKSYFPFLEGVGAEAHQGDVHVWIDGEVFNEGTFRKPGATEGFAHALLVHYREDALGKLLPQVDGVYIALIYDKKKKQLLFITDRYGLRPFYLCHRNNHLVIAPEVKCFAHFDMIPMNIRKDVIDCFMQLEHLLGNHTWLEHVVVAEPATVYTYHWDTDRLATSRYWSWSQIRRTTLSFDDAASALRESLHRANATRGHGNFGIGVALSGGLDSRAILAAVKERKPVTYTFGLENSDDVKIARRVAALAGVKHVHYDMKVSDWLPKRFSGVWKTDGMLNMYHMHYSHLMHEIPKIMDVNLSGFLGDAVIGGSYLGKKGKSFLNTRINAKIAQHYYGKFYEMSDPSDSFFDLDKVDPYLFYNRGRRMIGMGAEEAAKTIPQRLPFMDIQLMDLSYSFPDEYRTESKVYNQALLLQYPEFFDHIPDASTGLPIEVTPSLKSQLYAKINWAVYAVKYKLGIPTSYTDVFNWIKEPQTAEMIRQLLDPRKALYAQYTDHNYVDLYLTPHLQGKRNYMKQVMGAVTMEIWFQQLINKAYRPER